MQCDVGCGDCCGPVPASKEEYATIAAYTKKQGITPKRNGITCPFYQQGRCAVHEVRPAICRVFGHTAQLSCSRGYNVNVDETIVHKHLRAAGPPEEAQFLHQMLVDQAIASDLDDAFELLPASLRK